MSAPDIPPNAWTAQTLRLGPEAAPSPLVRVPAEPDRCSFLWRPGPQPLVLVHGWTQTADSTWRRLLEENNWPVLALDLPGHGHSRELPPAPDLAAAARAVHAACRSVGATDVHVVGHSLGGAVAAAACLLDPGLFASFTAVASTLLWPDPLRRYADRLLVPLRLPDVSAASMSGYIGSARRWLPGAPTLDATLGELGWLSDLEPSYWDGAALPDPLFVVSSSDRVLPAKWQRRSAALVRSAVVEVAGGHGFFVARPDRLAALLASHRNIDRSELRAAAASS